MKKLLVAGIAAAAFCAAPAAAADMPQPAPVYKTAPAHEAAPAPAFNWTGFYLGINGGYGWGTTTDNWFGDRDGNFDINGALFGGQIGFNYQFPASPLVLGLEADWDWSDNKGSDTYSPTGGVTVTNTAKIEDLGTVRGRIGYAWDRFLLFGTGGWAWSQRVTAEYTCTGPCAPAFASDSHSLNGDTVGAGVEYGIAPNLSVKAEYLYAHLRPTDYFVSTGCVPGAPGAGCSVGANVNLVRLGLNWRFTGLP